MQLPQPVKEVEEKEKPSARREVPEHARENARNPVNTGGETPGPDNLPQAEEGLGRTLLSEKPIARFDTHGTVAHVLADIDRHAPTIFGPEGEKALNSIHKLVRHYTANEKWTYVVASLSTGMARPEIEALLERDLGHEGPLVIDPDAGTETHQIFGSETEARVQKERLIQANEESGKILLVLYAVNNPDGNKDRELALSQLKKMTLTIDFFLEEDERFRQKWGLEPMDEWLKREFGRLGLHFSDLIHKVTGLISSNYLTEQHNKDFTDLFARLRNTLNLSSSGILPINLAILRLGIIPSRWADLGIVDEDAKLDAEMAHAAQEHRARLIRGWKPPEQLLREAAAHTQDERAKATADTIEARRKDTVHTDNEHRKAAAKAGEDRSEDNADNRDNAPRVRRATAQAQKRPSTEQRNEERTARVAAEDQAEFAHNRERTLHREARDDKLQSEHIAEMRRLRQAMTNARTPQERDHYARQIAAADSNFKVAGEQEEAIEIRERRGIQREAQARVEAVDEEIPAAQGTAEGAYTALAATPENRENTLEQRQRTQYALSERREGEREAANITEVREDQRKQAQEAAAKEPEMTTAQVARVETQADKNMETLTEPKKTVATNAVTDNPAEVESDLRRKPQQTASAAPTPTPGAEPPRPEPKG